MFHYNKKTKILKEGDLMKNTLKQSHFKYLFFAITVLLCAAIISLTVFLPKVKATSNKGTISSNKNTVSTDKTTELSQEQAELAAPQQAISQEKENPVKYRLIYAPQNMRMLVDAMEMPTVRGMDFFGDYAREFVSLFEGEDVYFRVQVNPIVFDEEKQEEGYTKEKGEELKNQRIQYVKDLGAKDMVLIPDIPNNRYVYYASLNAEMIKKIDEKGECAMQLVTAPRVDGYSPKISDHLTFYLEHTSEDESVAVRFYVQWPNGIESEKELFDKLKISDEQIITKEYFENVKETFYGPMLCRYTVIEGTFSKQQIKDIAPYVLGSGGMTHINMGMIFCKPGFMKDVTVIMNVTEDTVLPL